MNQFPLQQNALFFHRLALCHVIENDGNLALGRQADTNGPNVEPSIESIGVALKVRRLAGRGNTAVGFKPERFEIRRVFADPLAPQIGA